MLVVALQYKCNDYFCPVGNVARLSYLIYSLVVYVFDYHFIWKIKVRGFQFFLLGICVLDHDIFDVLHILNIFKIEPYVLPPHCKFL